MSNGFLNLTSMCKIAMGVFELHIFRIIQVKSEFM